MKHRRWWAVSMMSVAAIAGCDDAAPAGSDAGAGAGAGRSFRGTLPETVHGRPISRVFAINAKTGRTVASAVPNAQGQFNLDNLPKGATYRFAAQVNQASIPLVFPRQQGGTQKTNLFNVGARTSRVGSLDGPIDVGRVRTTVQDGETQITPADPMRAPNLQEDIDNDGMPDAADPDVDGDGTPNAMDMDNDGDGMADNAQFNDQDGDGVTNESDSDVDGDGTPNASDMDNDNDGTSDAMDMSPTGNTVGTPEDTDGDGVPNTEDTGDADTSRRTRPGLGGSPFTPERLARSTAASDPDFDAQLDPMNRPLNADPMTGEVRTPAMFMLPGATGLQAINQGGLSSCAAHSVTAAATLLRYRYESEGDINSRWASAAFLFSRGLARVNAQCSGSATVFEESVLDTLIREGSASRSEVPYDGTCTAIRPDLPAGEMSYRFRIGGYQAFKPLTRARVREAIAAGYPVIFGLDCPDNIGEPSDMASEYRGATPRVFRGVGPNDGGHSMLIVGYDDNRGSGAFRVLNSWGPEWGDQGAVWWDYADLEGHAEASGIIVTPLPAAPEPFIPQDATAFRNDLAILGRPVLTQSEGRWNLTMRLRLREPAHLRRAEVTPMGSSAAETQDFDQWVAYGNITINFDAQPAAGPAPITLRFRLFEQTSDTDVTRMITIPAPEANPTGMD